MTNPPTLNGNVVVLGFGTIGQCVLPLLIDRLGLPLSHFKVVDRTDPPGLLSQFTAEPSGAGLVFCRRDVNQDNLATVLGEITDPGDLLINLTMGIDSLEVADWCHNHGVRYIDTAMEPWEGYVDDSDLPAGERTEYVLHQRARKLAADTWRADGPTAVFAHGANPGLVSHFAKAAIIEVANALDLDFDQPASSPQWARLAQRTGTKVIHISERDTQVSSQPKMPGEFVNTWSVAGFIEEAMMPVELGWGSHERTMPPGGYRHAAGPCNTIYLDRVAARYFLYSWVPSHGQILGLALPHSETVTLSDYLTVGTGVDAGYRPTISFVYMPCDDAFVSLHEAMMGAWRAPEKTRIISDDIVSGQDELGVLLLGHPLNGLWYGSQLDIGEARRISPHSNPTALQVAAGVQAAALWVVANPSRGFCEPEDLPHDFILEAARPYLGRMVSRQTDWTPLQQRQFLDEPAEPLDPWQFANFRLVD